MKTITHSLALAACLGLAFAQPAAAQSGDGAVATATAVLDRMDAGDFEAAAQDFNAQMKAAINAEQLKGVQQQLDATGPVVSRSEPQVLQQGGLDVVVFRVERRNATLDAVVSIDGEGKVAGLQFVPATAAPAE